jgi:hypothetical protein
MKKESEYLSQTYSYLALRKTVGWIGILLPFVLVLGAFFLFGSRSILRNISLYYHTGMRDVFVGAICAIALFLFFYKGYNKWDNMASSLAAFFALGIAFFPTVREGPYNWQAYVHLVCAGCFFFILAFFSLFLFTRKEPKPSRAKLSRNKIYIICGSVMAACTSGILVFLGFISKNYPQSTFVFWAETIALIAFGISWLTKGGALYPDKKTK